MIISPRRCSLPRYAHWQNINPLNAELNPIYHLLALLGAHHILHVSKMRVNYTTKGVPIDILVTNCTVFRLFAGGQTVSISTTASLNPLLRKRHQRNKIQTSHRACKQFCKIAWTSTYVRSQEMGKNYNIRG